MAEVGELIDRAVVLPPGPELSALLAGLPWEKVPNARLVEVLQARSRQVAHDQAELYAGMVEISHAVALDRLLPGERAEGVARAQQQFEWASHEIAAGLTLTPSASDRELAFGTALCERLPLVYEAMRQGRIDRGKARVFVEYVDPANGDLTEKQTRRLCEKFVPLAPGLTTKQLADRLYRAMEAIDPGIRRRRYERAVQQRSLAVYLNPRTGTATLVGDGLPPDEAAAAVARNDRMVEAAKRAGHPGTRRQIGVDVFLGMLTGQLHGLTEDEIITRVLAKHRLEDNPKPDTDTEAADDTEHATGENGDDSEQHAEPGESPGPSSGQNSDRWAGDHVATREGIEIRLGLGTAAGLDDRPGEIPGGPHARPRTRRPDRRGQHRPGVPAPPPGQRPGLEAHPTRTGTVPVGQPTRAHLRHPG